MAQPYLIAMEHAEWHAKNVLKKFHKNRPLGRIENQHRYCPPQPVLSSRTVDIDSNGTRTYRSMSNKDIIEEQHKLIHEIYSKARNITSAPAAGRPPTGRPTSPRRPELESRSLTSLKINGQRPSTSSPSIGSRPTSSKVSSRPSSSKSTKSSFIILKVRPHTTGSRKYRPHPVARTQINLEEWNNDWEETNLAYQTSRNQIKRTWEEENRSLDEGKFVRGKKDKPSVSSSLDPKAGQAWMSFGGGQNDRSAGIVDAFTAVKQEDKYFSIDGSTGMTVARQVHKGDKIRIGKNGQPSSLDNDFQQWIKEKQKKLEKLEEETVHPKAKIIPLSWNDQVSLSDEKVIEPRVEQAPTAKDNLCESHPVVFKKFGVDGSRPPPAIKNAKKKQTGVKVIEGYVVTRRTGDRIGIDGKTERPTNKVTHIAVSKPDEEVAAQSEVSYEDVLEMRIRNKSAKGPHVYDEVNTAAKKFGKQQEQPKQQQQQNGEIILNHVSKEGTDIEEVGLRSASKSSVLSDEGRKSILRGRPATTTASNSSTELRGFVVASGNGNNSKYSSPRINSATSSLPTSISSGRKAKPASASGQSRPPPAKPVLHKTSAASGSSISSHKKGVGNGSLNGGDSAEYLHFSQQLCISKDHGNPKESKITKEDVRLAGENVSNAAIQSVIEHNKPVKDVKFKDEIAEFVEDDTNHTEEEDPSYQYAFNIPTAGPDEQMSVREGTPHRLDTPQARIEENETS